MTPADALCAIPLWTAAGALIAVIAARIVRALNTPIDHEGNPHDR